MDLFKRIQNLSAVYDDDGPSAMVQESRPMFNDGGMLVQPSDDGSRPGYAKMKLDKDTIQKIKNKITLKKGQKWNFYDPETNPKGHTYGVPKGDTNYDIARNLKPGRLEAKLEKATEKYKEIKSNPKLLAEKKLTDKERYQTNRTQILEDRNFQYETNKDYREKKLEWAKQDRIKNPEKYKQKLNNYFAKKGKFPPGNNYKENVWRDMFRSSQKAGQERFLLVGEDGKLLTSDKFPMKDGKVRWDIGGAYKKAKFYDTKTNQFVKFDNTIKGKGISFEKYLNQKSVGGKGAYENAINGYRNKDSIKNITFKNSKGKTIRLGTIVQSKLNNGINFINSGVNVQHPDINNSFWKNEVTLASSNNKLNYLEKTLNRKLKNAGNDVNLRNKALNDFKIKINKLPGGITKIIDNETFGTIPTEKSVVQEIGKESRLGNFKGFKNLGKFTKPSNNQAGFISRELLEDVAKKIGSVGRKVTAIGSAGLTEALFYLVDKKNMESKGIGEQEASDQAIENLTFGFNKNKTYMNSLKKTAEDMGIDPSAFDSAQKLNVLSKQYNQNTKSVQDQVDTALLNNDQKTADDLIKNFTVYSDRTKKEYERLENDIAGRVSGGSPQIMSNAKNFLTEEQFAKPFYDMQDVAIEKLKREKLRAFPTQKLQSNTAAGDTGNTLLSNVFNKQSLPRAGKFLFDLANPFSPLPKYKDYLSDAEKENQMLRSLEPSDLNLVNLARGFTRDNIRSADIESPILADDIENIKYENPGVFFAGGGIAKIAGDRSGAMTRSMNPDSQGLSYLFNRAMKIKE